MFKRKREVMKIGIYLAHLNSSVVLASTLPPSEQLVNSKSGVSVYDV